jgi:hypothetical protein
MMSGVRSYTRWVDEEVRRWAELYLDSEESTLITLETDTGVSHSTTSWCFRNRLERIDYQLYHKVMEKIIRHINNRGKKKVKPLH